jgi:hypothetical protein
LLSDCANNRQGPILRQSPGQKHALQKGVTAISVNANSYLWGAACNKADEMRLKSQYWSGLRHTRKAIYVEFVVI